MNINTWWADRPEEHYWLEVTGRDDLGTNLKTPQTNEQGNPFWSYSLLQHTQPGDIVFHYSQPVQAIVGRSIVTSSSWDDDVRWAARGTAARSARISPHTRPGWYRGLTQYCTLNPPLSLAAIRAETETLRTLRDALAATNGRLYFPFELSTTRPIRPMQGYLFKLPAFFISMFAAILNAPYLTHNELRSSNGGGLGSVYRRADPETTVDSGDLFTRDLELVERGLRSHATTQNALASYLETQGLTPLSPTTNDPNFDLAWQHETTLWVAEVKSITEANEEKQLRLGLGQILRYRYLLRHHGSVQAVLVTEREPSDTSWIGLCALVDVLLIWPESWENYITVAPRWSSLE